MKYPHIPEIFVQLKIPPFICNRNLHYSV